MLFRLSVLIVILYLHTNNLIANDEPNSSKIPYENIWSHYSIPFPEKTLEVIEKNIQKSKNVNSLEYLELQVAAATINIWLENFEKARKNLSSVNIETENHSKKTMFKYYLTHSLLDYSTTNYNKAMHWLSLAEKLTLKKQDDFLMGKFYFLKGNIIFWNTQKVEVNKSKEILLKAIETYRSKNDQVALAYNYHAIFDILRLADRDDEAETYRTKALDLSQSIQNKELETIILLAELNQVLYLNQLDKAEELINLINPFIKKSKPSVKIRFKANLGRFYADKGNLEKAIQYLQESKNFYVKANHYENAISVSMVMASAYNDIGDFNKSLSILFDTLKIIDKNNLSKIKPMILGNITIIYRKLGQYSKAEKLLLENIENNKLNNRFIYLANDYLNLAGIYDDQEKFNKALQLYKKSLDISNKYNIASISLYSCTKIADIQKAQNQIKKAMNTANECLGKAKDLNDHKVIFNLYMVISNLFIHMENYTNALINLETAEKFIDQLDMIEQDYFYDTLITIYKNQKNYKLAFEQLEKKSQLVEEHNQLTHDKAFAEMAEKYEAKQKESEISLLNKEKNNQQLLLNKQQIEIEQEVFLKKLILFSSLFFIIFSVLFIRYITSRKENQRIKDKVRERTKELESKTRSINHLFNKYMELYQNFSHEFRTPISIIAGNLDRLSSKILDNESKQQSLKVAKKNTEQLSDLIERVIEQSKPASIHQEEAYTADSHKIINEIIEYFDSSKEKNNISINANLAEVYPIKIPQDSFEQILKNLLSNAIKYTNEPGTIDIELSQNTSWVTLKIQDSGIGIATNQQQKVFERFYRSPDIHSDIIGTGLGLALVKEAIDLCGGKISLSSEVGQGSCFKLDFPLASEIYIGEQAKPHSSAEKKHYSVNSNTTSITSDNNKNIDNQKLVLIVEDNHDLSQLIATYYSEQGTQTLIAKNGKDAFEIAKQHVPDIIISDINMPIMDGFQLLQNIKQDTITSHIPVILLTAKVSVESRIKGWNLDADGYLAKPFDLVELFSLSQSLLNNRKIIKNAWSASIKTEDEIKNEADSTSDILSQQFISKLNQVLSEHIENSDLTIVDIAEHLALSTRSFQRKLKGITGQSPSLYLRIFRLEKAKQLILQGQQINDVTYLTGFKYPSNFSAAYKNHFGILPSAEKSIQDQLT